MNYASLHAFKKKYIYIFNNFNLCLNCIQKIYKAIIFINVTITVVMVKSINGFIYNLKFF